MNDHHTQLRHDLLYLHCILYHATENHPPRTPKQRTTQSSLHDHLTWLTVDAMDDEELARRLVPTLTKIQEELNAEAESRRVLNRDPTGPAFHEGYLHGLEQAISFRYGIDLLLDEAISRAEFFKSWEKTRKTLGL